MILQFGGRLRGSNHQLPPTVVSTRGREIRCVHEPPHLKKGFVLLKPCSVLNTSEVTVSVVVQDRRNLRRPNIWVIKVPTSGSSSLVDKRGRDGLLRDRLDFRDFARIQERVRSTTERGADIESEDKFSRGAGVRCAGHWGMRTLL